MAYLASNLLQDAYRKLGMLEVRTATGGSTTTVVDSGFVGIKNAPKDDAWLNGTLFIVRDAAGTNVAPENEFQRISGYAASTGTFTLDTALTSSASASDTYAYTTAEVPLRSMLELANAALQALGTISLVDTTTLDTASPQTEYACSAIWKRPRPIRVDVQGNSDSGDNAWIESRDWDYQPATGGATGLIIFGHQPESGMGIRVWYNGLHPTLTAYNSVVHESVPPELAALTLAEKALEWLNTRYRGSDEFMLQRLSDAKVQRQQYEATNPVWRVRRKPKLLITAEYAADVFPSRYGPVWRK